MSSGGILKSQCIAIMDGYLLSLVWVISGWTFHRFFVVLLPARASEQGNVIGSVRIYIYICVYKKKL